MNPKGENITITISGELASGKTTICEEIEALMRCLGFDVTNDDIDNDDSLVAPLMVRTLVHRDEPFHERRLDALRKRGVQVTLVTSTIYRDRTKR